MTTNKAAIANVQRDPGNPAKGLPEMTTPQPSVAVMKLSKAQYVELCDTYRDKAQQAHQDARVWANRAIVAESRLATLRAAYEPEGMEPTC